MVFRPGGPFDAFEREFEEMNRMMDRMFERLRGSDWSRYAGGEPLYYGVSVNVGPDGVPRVQEFGNVRPGQARLEAGVREPFVTSMVDDEHHQLRITAEMPGIERDQVKVEIVDDSLVLRGEGEDRRYEKTLPLTVDVDPESAKARCNNGVLEVTATLREPRTPSGRDVKVE